MKTITRVAAFALTAVAATTSLKALDNAVQQEDTQQAAAASRDYSKTNAASTNAVATGKDVKAPVVPAATTPAFTLLVSENYDSRYMFRGVDVLAGTGLLSTTFAPTWHITANDAITVPLWYATAVKSNKNASAYRELDIPVNYLHTFDSGFNLGAGYTLYNYFNLPGGNRPGGTGIQNEVNVTAGYSKALKNGITLNSSLTYYYELGTANQYTYGSINPGSSFLTPSLGATIPLNFIKKDGSVTSTRTRSITSRLFTILIKTAPTFPEPTTGSSNFQSLGRSPRSGPLLVTGLIPIKVSTYTTPAPPLDGQVVVWECPSKTFIG